jgi:hypothetical protein
MLDRSSEVEDAFARLGIGLPELTEPPPYDHIPECADGEPAPEPMNGAAAADILPFDTFDASQWQGVSIEPRRWIAHNRIPVGEPGIMSGDGGTGKTKLALQLAVAIPGGLRIGLAAWLRPRGLSLFFRPRKS